MVIKTKQQQQQQKTEDKSIDEDEEKLEPYTLLVGLQNGYSCYLRVCRFLKILKVDLLYDLVIPFFWIFIQIFLDFLIIEIIISK